VKTQKETLRRTASQEEPALVAERLMLLNPEGVARMGNGGVVGLERLMVCDDHGTIGLDAKVTEEGTPALAFMDRGVPRAGIGIHKGKVGLFLCDREGTVRTSLTVTAEGLPTLSFYDATGARRALLGVTDKGESILALADHADAPRLVLSTTQDDPTLWVLNEKGKVVWEVAESTQTGDRKTSATRSTARRTRQQPPTR
jgi:hypothetical protein